MYLHTLTKLTYQLEISGISFKIIIYQYKYCNSHQLFVNLLIYNQLNQNKMEEYLPLIIQLVTGAVGGNVAGKLLKNLSLGTLGNSITGILGGGIGGQLLGMLGLGTDAATGGSMDISSILGSVAGGGVGGGVIMAVIGLIKNAMSK